MFNFGDVSASAVLELGQSLLATLTGGSSLGVVAGTEDELRAAGVAAAQIAELFEVAADAVADGTLSWQEVLEIIDEADDIPVAVGMIASGEIYVEDDEDLA